MAAYNRRWYILASIIAGLGIGLIGATLGTEELIEMEFTDIDYAIADDVCQDVPLTRKVGLVTGSDSLCGLEGAISFPHWSVPCSGKVDYCSSREDEKIGRLCECSQDNKSVTPTYTTGLHWAIFSLLMVAALIAVYGTGVAFYNGITKPTQEIFSVRAVLATMCSAIIINLICVILTIVYFYGSYKTEVDCDSGNSDMTCYSCALLENSRMQTVPSRQQGYVCTSVSLGISFYFQLLSLVCFGLSIGASFMGQRGFQSIDETSKIDQTKQKDVGVESSMMF